MTAQRSNPYKTAHAHAAPARDERPPIAKTAPAVPEAHALAKLQGTFDEIDRLNEMLTYADEHYNLISPATSCGQMAEGWAVALCAVRVSPLVDKGEIYEHRTRRGYYALTKVALEKIASAAAVSWIPSACHRLDDGCAPHYCLFSAAGVIEHFDGTEMIRPATKELDLREGSPEYLQMLAEAREDKDPQARIRYARVHLVRLAESKAKNAAIRTLGVRSAYTLLDIAKPFVVARRVFTGRTNDPDLKRLFAERLLARRGEATRALYLAPPPPTIKAPPVGETLEVRDEEDDGPRPSVPSAPAQKPAAPPPAASTLSGFKVPGRKGEDAGKPIEVAKTDNLVWWATKLANDVKNGTLFAEDDKQRLAAIHAELRKRNGGPADPLADDVIPY